MADLIPATSTYVPNPSGEGYLTRRLGCNIGCQTGWNHYYLPTDPVPDFSNDPLWQRLRAEADASRAAHGGKSPPYFPELSDSSTELARFPLTPGRTPPPPPRPPQLRSLFRSTPPSSEKAIFHQRDPEDPTPSASNAMSMTSPKSIQWPLRRPTTRSRRVGTFFSLGNTFGRVVKQSGKQRSQLSYAQVVKALGSSFSRIETATN